MTNEEKQEMARQLENSIADLTSYLTIEPEPADSDDIRWRIKVESLALAALTAQPVKLPDVRIFCNSNKSHRKVIYAVTDAIRAAGYEVQE